MTAPAKAQKILLVDDDDSIRWVLNETLSDAGFQVCQAANVEKARFELEKQDFDLLISDIRMPGDDGISLLTYCQQERPDLPVIIMTAHSDLESAVGAYQSGAFEYLPKPFDLDEVIHTVERALSSRQAIVKQKPATPPSRYSIIGEAPAMQNLYRAIGRLSNSQVTVLIRGESGTGKELVARALHQHSPRNDKPFIALNMAAIPRDLIESELFGHEKGAFTGAAGRYLGRFEQADGGTLFLDEIGDMPLETQTRLLRVLSEGAFYRIGSTQPTRVNVRIIAATHQDLQSKVESGEFREDLFHRLNVIPLHLPPLRERLEDVPLLAEHFLTQIGKELNEPRKYLTDEALQIMQCFNWPGNVRQLENTCRWLSVMANSQSILAADLPEELQPAAAANELTPDWQSGLRQHLIGRFQKGDNRILEQIQTELEALLITTALELTGGKKAEASALLGWGRNTLTRKLKDHQLD